ELSAEGKGRFKDQLNDTQKTELKRIIAEIETDYNTQLERGKKSNEKIKDNTERKAANNKLKEELEAKQSKEFEDKASVYIQHTGLSDVIPTSSSGMSTEDAQMKMDELKSKLTPDQVKLLDEYSSKMQEVFHKILDLKLEAG